MKTTITKRLTTMSKERILNISRKAFILFNEEFPTVDTKSLSLYFGNDSKARLYGRYDFEKNRVYINLSTCNTVGQLIETLFHELAHVRQIRKKILIINKEKTSLLWYGVPYPNNENAPWEHDAESVSLELSKKYFGITNDCFAPLLYGTHHPY